MARTKSNERIVAVNKRPTSHSALVSRSDSFVEASPWSVRPTWFDRSGVNEACPVRRNAFHRLLHFCEEVAAIDVMTCDRTSQDCNDAPIGQRPQADKMCG